MMLAKAYEKTGDERRMRGQLKAAADASPSNADLQYTYGAAAFNAADLGGPIAALGKAPDDVRVVATMMGGGFGGKEDIAGQIHVALLAEATGVVSAELVFVLDAVAAAIAHHPDAPIVSVESGLREQDLDRLVAHRFLPAFMFTPSPAIRRSPARDTLRTRP